MSDGSSDQWTSIMLDTWVLIFVFYMVSIAIVSRKRSKFFPKSFMEENFGEQHFGLFANHLGAGGFPDNGNGIYSDKLPYSQWFELNCAQRCQYQAIEQLIIFAPLSILVTANSNMLAAILNVVWVVGRVLYTIGYMKHPNKRAIGALVSDAALVGALVIVFLTSIADYLEYDV